MEECLHITDINRAIPITLKKAGLWISDFILILCILYGLFDNFYEKVITMNDRITEKFLKLGVVNAPGQEVRQSTAALDLRGEKLTGRPVDFSHGDVDAHPPYSRRP